MSVKSNLKPQTPLILRCQRLIEAFAKSDDERDFYLDRLEGFIVYVDLDKSSHDLESLEKELKNHADRYCLIPKLTFYETKKIMEGFVNEKVYDIDTKEKLLDIIQSKEARENFLEFVYDHHAELEKWQLYYQERSRIRIIEWLRNNHFNFVFEEDLEMPKGVVEKVKRDHFEPKPSKDVLNARKSIIAKSKSYYSSEALNPRPKRGRPPKQIIKSEVEPTTTLDIYSSVPSEAQLFLFTPDHSISSIIAFSSKFENEEQMFASRKSNAAQPHLTLEGLNQKLAALRNLSSRWLEHENKPESVPNVASDFDSDEEDEEYSDFDDDEEDDEGDEWSEDEEIEVKKAPKSKIGQKANQKTAPKSKPAKPAKAVLPTKQLKPVLPAKQVKPVMPAKKAPPKQVVQKNNQKQVKPVVAAKKQVVTKKKPLAKVVAKSPAKKSEKKLPIKKGKKR